ncbi:glycerophosphoryl diester phosphodiesterase membrane domain-containing protein [Lutibacter sp. B2]|nr:glycerophosphoryl diester phosphodiesterase membrane domain-containing protein [Lutibacter sp. B2]
MDTEKFSSMSITKILDKALDTHKNSIWTSAPYMFIYNLIGLIVGVVILIVLVLGFGAFTMFGGFGYNKISMLEDIASPFMYTNITIFAGIIYLGIFSFTLTKKVGIVEITNKKLFNKRADIVKVLGVAFKNIPRILSVIIAGTILFLPAIIVFGGIVIGFGISLENNTMHFIIGAILFGLSFIAVVTCFLTVHVFSVQVAVLENLYFFKALKRSRQLVKNNFWKIYGSLLISTLAIGAITYSIYSFFGVILGIFYLILMASGIETEILASLAMIGNLIRTPLQLILSLFIAPIGGIFTTLLYYNQRFKKEGYDLTLRLEKMKETESIIKGEEK